MSKEWGKYKRILDREDEEFRKAMEEEVSTLFSSKFSNKYWIFAGVDIITQSQINPPIFKEFLALFHDCYKVYKFSLLLRGLDPKH